MTSDRTMSPTAAAAHAKKAIRQRCKALRLGAPVDPPAIFAGRLSGYAEATSKAFPEPWSDAYAAHVVNAYADRYVSLCRVAPLMEKAGAR